MEKQLCKRDREERKGERRRERRGREGKRGRGEGRKRGGGRGRRRGSCRELPGGGRSTPVWLGNNQLMELGGVMVWLSDWSEV